MPMARAISRANHERQVAALRALAAEISGDRRHFRRQPLEPRLPARLELAGTTIALELLDLSSGGALAQAQSSAALPLMASGHLVTGSTGRGRRVQLRWIRSHGRGQQLGLAFEGPAAP